MKTTPPNANRVRTGPLGSDDSIGMNGAFIFTRKNKNKLHTIRCIVSDGITSDWEHVSVTVEKQRCPTWEEMCVVKDIFWEKDETVIQFHPPESDYISEHNYCLHLWKKVGQNAELPPSILVGYKLKGK